MTITPAAEPILDVAQLAHVELLTPDPEASAAFFRDHLGLIESGRDAEAVYLRGYEEHQHHSLKLSAAARPGLGHVAWKSRSPAALDRRVAALTAAGFGRGWSDGDLGHGPAFRFVSPEGHPMEIVWETHPAVAPEGAGTALRNRPQRRPLGAMARRIDHLNLMAADTRVVRDFLGNLLGFNERERVEGGETVLASFLSVTNLSHDIGLVPETSPERGRLHHVCYYAGALQHLYDLADTAREAGLGIEHGPGRHGIGGASFLYLLEPGGNRIELIGEPGYMVFDPAWRTIVWPATELDIGVAWSGARPPDSFWIYGTPPAAPAADAAA